MLAVREPGQALSRRLQLHGRRGGERPLPHLRVGPGGQVDTVAGRAGREVAREGRQREPRRHPEGVEEAPEPALSVDQPVRPRPDPELLAVIDEGDGAGATAPLQIAHRLLRVGEGHQVTHPLADRKHRERRALLLGQVIAPERLGLQADGGEVGIVEEHELHARVAQRLRELRLPHPLGQPHAARAHAEARLEELCHRLDLAHFVPVGEHGEDRLVEAAGQELDATARHERPEQVEGGARPVTEELQQYARAVDRHRQLGDLAQDLEERVVGSVDRVPDDRFEVPGRLVIVDAEEEGELLTHGPDPGGARWAASPFPRGTRAAPPPGSRSGGAPPCTRSPA